MEENRICLVISPELMDRMDKNYILREDVETVIAHSEKSSCKLYDPDRDCYIGHAMIDNMTLWAEYRKVSGRYELLATYMHRMKIMDK